MTDASLEWRAETYNEPGFAEAMAATVDNLADSEFPYQVPTFSLQVGDWDAVYELTRVVFVRPEHIAAFGKRLQVGMLVQLTEEVHSSDDDGWDINGLLGPGNKWTVRFTIKNICACGSCIELEHTFLTWYSMLGAIDIGEDLHGEDQPPSHPFLYSQTYMFTEDSVDYLRTTCGKPPKDAKLLLDCGIHVRHMCGCIETDVIHRTLVRHVDFYDSDQYN